MPFNEKSERLRRQVLGRFTFWLFQWKTLPLAGFAGLRIRTLDEARCTVSLPGGWRTQNPFRSTYFGAQAMAAEMSTGAPAMVLVGGASASVAMLVREVRGTFVKKIVGPSVFTCDDVAALRAAIDRAAATGEAETFVAHSVGTMADGTVGAEFEITWSFKRRG
jgi:hypothetical protein